VTLPAFTFTERARPFLEIGLGDTRMATGLGRWDVDRWDDPAATWASTEPTWLDVSCEAFAARCEYGRQRSTDRFVPGAATVEVLNASGWADPYATADAAALEMRPGRAIRFGVDHVELGRLVLWRGFIDSMVPTYDAGSYDRVSFSCIDALGEVNRAKLAGVSAGPDGEALSARVTRILDAALWSAQKRDVAYSYVSLVAAELDGQVADLLGRTADSGGAAVFGDRNGNVVLRGRDWQTFLPDVPPAATIGNVGKGEPGYVIPGADGYLTPTVGTVSSMDPGPWPTPCVYVFDVDGPVVGGGARDIAAMFDGPGREWRLVRESNAGQGSIGLITYPSGTTSPVVVTYGNNPGDTALDGTRQRWALAFHRDNGAGLRVARTLRWTGTAWSQIAERTAAATTYTDATTPLRIGSWAGGSTPWTGRIYSVELRTGLDPSAGSVVWRFDANDYTTGTSYTDPRGRVWTLTVAGAITPRAPDVVVPPVPADVCPVSWRRPFNRADITTRAIMGRDRETAVVRDDIAGQTVYGIEPFERVDLWTRETEELEDLADRALRVRSYATAPVVRGVLLDASTSDAALDLMATADPYEPTRYRGRLELDRGLVFDDEFLVTGIVHELTSRRWETNLVLDLAAPFAAAGGRWDEASYWDLATWTVEV
jgi:hypothetical protein